MKQQVAILPEQIDRIDGGMQGLDPNPVVKFNQKLLDRYRAIGD
jgi:hypothetical protein